MPMRTEMGWQQDSSAGYQSNLNTEGTEQQWAFKVSWNLKAVCLLLSLLSKMHVENREFRVRAELSWPGNENKIELCSHC